MSGLELDDDLRTLLETRLDSFEKLEIMRTLRATRTPMSLSELETACAAPSDLLADALADLERAKLVERDRPNRRFRLGAVADEPRLASLMQLYDEDRTGVLAALSSTVMQRLRSMAARAFADAFVIRKKRDKDG